MTTPTKFLYSIDMTWKQVIARLIGVFVASASANIGIGAAIDIGVVQAAALAGANAVLAVIHRLAIAYSDGKLEVYEIKEALDA